MSERALAAAIWPKRYGSSTIGVKKSTDCKSRPPPKGTYPASSLVSIPLTNPSAAAGERPLSTCSRSPGANLEAQPAFCEYFVSLMRVFSSMRRLYLRTFPRLCSLLHQLSQAIRSCSALQVPARLAPGVEGSVERIIDLSVSQQPGQRPLVSDAAGRATGCDPRPGRRIHDRIPDPPLPTSPVSGERAGEELWPRVKAGGLVPPYSRAPQPRLRSSPVTLRARKEAPAPRPGPLRARKSGLPPP